MILAKTHVPNQIAIKRKNNTTVPKAQGSQMAGECGVEEVSAMSLRFYSDLNPKESQVSVCQASFHTP